MQGLDAGYIDEGPCAGAGVTGMFAQVKRQAAARDLRIERKIVSEAMFPIGGEAEKVPVELEGFFDGEYSISTP